MRRRLRLPQIAHHGIQRSGTNYLLGCLDQLGLFVANRFNPERDDPSHKHFRWYRDKSQIPVVLQDSFGNDQMADTIEDVNRQAGFSTATKHIVIKKEHSPAVKSLLNWGLRCGWFNSREEALASAEDISDDYRAYSSFWSRMQKNHPGQVAVIHYEDLVKDAQILVRGLKNLGVPTSFPAQQFRFSEVNMSPTDRVEQITLGDIETLFADHCR